MKSSCIGMAGAWEEMCGKCLKTLKWQTNRRLAGSFLYPPCRQWGRGAPDGGGAGQAGPGLAPPLPPGWRGRNGRACVGLGAAQPIGADLTGL